MKIDALASQLIELRQTSKRLMDSSDIEGWLTSIAEEISVAARLQSLLLHHPTVVTEDPAVKELLAGFDRTNLVDLDRAGMDLLWGSISPEDCATNLAMVDVLLAPFHLPSELQQFLCEARECYAIGHHAACSLSVARSSKQPSMTLQFAPANYLQKSSSEICSASILPAAALT